MKKLPFGALLCMLMGLSAHAQQEPQSKGRLNGNFQLNTQYYLRDSIIDPTGAADPPEKLRAAGFLNLTYTHGDFMAGIRYENYQNNLIGLPEGFQGEGVPYRFIRYKRDGLDVTVGNFYDQFGSGLVFRAYEERGLGLDNALDGVRLNYEIRPGLNAKALIGRQRFYFETGRGIVRGGDLEFNRNDFTGNYGSNNIIIGASMLSRYQVSQDPFLNLPGNVATFGARANIIAGNFNFFGEYAYKSQDPNSSNRFIFKPGHALYSTASYTKGNLGIIAGVKYYDNFLFRSERVGNLTELLINYLPPLAELHTYALPALYAYNIQANGETGMQFELSYKFDRSSLLGGKYGTMINFNFSNSYALDKNFESRLDINDEPTIEGTDGYQNLPGIGDIQYAQDFNVELKSKLNKKLKGTFTYYNFIYNQSAILDGVVDDLIQPDTDIKMVYVDAFVAELLWKIKRGHSLRTEAQLMLTEQDRGSWAMLLFEYSIAPTWIFALQNTYNYSHPDPDLRVHYPLVSLGYTRGTTKFLLNYGRQQEGVFCVGGICRVVPASNGFSMLITTNF